MTPAQCRMARAALEMEIRVLAERAKVATGTIVRLERGEALKERTIDAVKAALEAAGVEFTNSDQPGVKLIKNAKGAEEISRQIDALKDKISSMPVPTEPSPEAGMNIMRKAVAKNDLTKLKNRRARITRRGTKAPP